MKEPERPRPAVMQSRDPVPCSLEASARLRFVVSSSSVASFSASFPAPPTFLLTIHATLYTPLFILLRVTPDLDADGPVET